MGCFDPAVKASDGVLASGKLKNQSFDIIILDINMPKRSGVETLKELAADKRAVNKAANVIVISGFLEKEKMEAIISCGCRNFLVKPFDEASFQEKVLKVLQLQKAK
jgi:YesN/AraC family two-component response regulator